MKKDPVTGLYVSKDGLLFKCVGRVREPEKHRLAPAKSRDAHGYERSMTKKAEFVHRIVFRAFIGDIPVGFQVDHIDGNKKNNSITNLQLLTQSENMKKAYEQGFAKPSSGCFKKGHALCPTSFKKGHKPWNKGMEHDSYKNHYKTGFKNQFSKESV